MICDRDYIGIVLLFKKLSTFAHFSRNLLLDNRRGGKHEATRRVIPGSERVQDLNADPVRDCDNVAVDRILNHFGALAFVTHLSAVVVSAEESDQPRGLWTKKKQGGRPLEREKEKQEGGAGVPYTTVPL